MCERDGRRRTIFHVTTVYFVALVKFGPELSRLPYTPDAGGRPRNPSTAASHIIHSQLLGSVSPTEKKDHGRNTPSSRRAPCVRGLQSACSAGDVIATPSPELAPNRPRRRNYRGKRGKATRSLFVRSTKYITRTPAPHARRQQWRASYPRLSFPPLLSPFFSQTLLSQQQKHNQDSCRFLCQITLGAGDLGRCCC